MNHLLNVEIQILDLVRRAVASNQPTSFAADLYALWQARASNPGSAFRDEISLYIAGEFLAIAGKRLNAKDLLERYGASHVEGEAREGMSITLSSCTVADSSARIHIFFDGGSRIFEYHYGSNRELQYVFCLNDNTGLNPDAYNQDTGQYSEATVLSIIEYRTFEGKKQSRSFNYVGALTKDWT
jgi:hypothetical protein